MAIYKAGFAVYKDRKVMFVRHRNGFIFTLGGKYEDGETARDCIIREVKEEIGCDVFGATIHFQTFNGLWKGEPVRIDMFEGVIKGEPTPLNEIDEILWLNTQSFVKIGEITPLTVEIIQKLHERGRID